jgi:TPR repeat protein
MKFLLLVFLLGLHLVARPAAFDSQTLAQLLPLARSGQAEAQYHLGMLYNNGMGGAVQDSAQAFEWFSKSAAGGDPLAAYKVGCYYAGQFPGTVAPDEAQALGHKLVAARAGYALAQHDVALAYQRAGDPAAAGQWWEQAAAQGFAPAVYALSSWHHAGGRIPMAYTYFKLSQRVARGQISAKAQEALDRMAEKMSPQELIEAEFRVATWLASPSELTRAARAPAARIEALLKAATPAADAADARPGPLK